MDVPSVPNGDVTIGIRPEGFDPDPNGTLTCKLQRMEVMGRDVSIICQHPQCENTDIRAIVDASITIDLSQPTIRFALDRSKVLLFDPNSGNRIRF